jgi:glutamyl-tRNA reductase
MHLFLLGVSHRTAPVDLREQIDFAARGLDQALAAVAQKPSNAEAVVLSTCNRAELYVASANPDAARVDLVEFLTEYHGVTSEALAPHLYEKRDGEVARHLFRVAAGLDSLVVGEPQILGQVKDAYAAASEQHAVGQLLNKLFHWSFIVGKRVRSETSVAEGAVSVSYAAVELAKKIFGRLKGRSVLVIGAGEMGKLTALHLQAQGVARVVITSRTAAHAAALAEAIGGATTAPWEQLQASLADADIAVTATGARVPVLMKAGVEAAMRQRRNRPLFLIDIAVPRDVDPAAGDLEQVFLYNIDDLQAVVHENMSRRASEVGRAEAIVEEEVGRFAVWLQSRRAIPTVVALRQRFEAVRRAELLRLRPKLASLPPEAQARVDEITRLIVEKLLLTPTEQLKSVPDPDVMVAYSEALTRLFSLDEPAEGGQAPAEQGARD